MARSDLASQFCRFDSGSWRKNWAIVGSVALPFVLCTLDVCISQEPTSGFPDYRSAVDQHRILSTACGPLSLLSILEHEGLEVATEDRKRLINLAGENGTDLYTLGEHAKTYGLNVASLLISPESLAKGGIPAIARLDGYSFVAVLSYPKKRFSLRYPGGETVVLDLSEFKKRFGKKGYALLVSRKRFSINDPSESVEQVRASPTVVAIGRITSNVWKTSFSLINQSDEPVNILSVAHSCSCFHAVPRRAQIAPGKSVMFDALGTQAEYSDFAHQIAITLAEESEPIVVHFRGERSPPIYLTTPSIVFNPLISGHSAQLDCFAYATQRISPGDISFEVPKSPIAIENVSILDDGVISFHVNWKGSVPAALGWHRYQIPVLFADMGKVCTLRVAAYVCPDFDISPKRLFIADDEYTTKWQRTLEIRLPIQQAGGKLSVQWESPELNDKLQLKLESRANHTRVHVSPTEVRLSPMVAKIVVSLGPRLLTTVPVCIGDESFDSLEEK